MKVYYNDNDQHVAQWLRNLVSDGLIPPGDVDYRSIEEVTADDIRHYDQVHLFAGIAGWAVALQLAGLDTMPGVWSFSCPCQPVSSAGARQGAADRRHLWPVVHELIAELRPAMCFGEQTASDLGREWLAGVRYDMGELGYACGAADLPAASLGAPHIRQRLWFTAYDLANPPSFERRRPRPDDWLGALRRQWARADEDMADGDGIGRPRLQPGGAGRLPGDGHGGGEPLPGLGHGRADDVLADPGCGGVQSERPELPRTGQSPCTREGVHPILADAPSGSSDDVVADHERDPRESGRAPDQPGGSDAPQTAWPPGEPGRRGGDDVVGDTDSQRRIGRETGPRPSSIETPGPQCPDPVGHPDCTRRQGWSEDAGEFASGQSPAASIAAYRTDFVSLIDGTVRRVPTESWKPQSRVLYMADGFLYGLADVIAEIEAQAVEGVVTYGASHDASPREVLRMVRQHIGETPPRVGQVGGPRRVHETEVLFSFLQRVESACDRGPNCGGEQEACSQDRQAELRDLRLVVQSECAPHRQQPDEQRPVEPPGALCELSRFLARCCETEGDSRARADAVHLPLTEHAEGRVAKLRASGNAIVPQVAAVFIAAAVDAIAEAAQ